MKLRFTPRAVADLMGIAEYLQARNPAAARSARAAIYQGLQTISLFPNAGRQQKTPGVRKLVTRRYGYLVYDSTDEAADEIVILSIKQPACRREHEDT